LSGHRIMRSSKSVDAISESQAGSV